MRTINAGAVALALATLVAACSDDDGGADAEPSVEERFGDAPVTIDRDVSLDECGFTRLTGGRPYAAGTITNSHDETLTYVIDVEIDVSIDIPDGPEPPTEPFGAGPTSAVFLNVEEVAPGETVEWREVDEFWMGPEGLVVDWIGEADCTLSPVEGYSWLEVDP